MPAVVPPMHSLNDLPPQFLLGLRDALSAALNVSITVVDEKGKESAASRYHVGRRFTLDVCQLHHCSEGSSVKKAVCDVWDKKAVDTIGGGKDTFDECCGLGYNCFAAAMRTPAASYGTIFAGERRITGQVSSPFLKRALDLLELTGNKRDHYIQRWKSSLEEPFQVTPNTWSEITATVAVFAKFLAICVEEWDPEIRQWSSIKSDLLRTAPKVRLVMDRVLSKLDPSHRNIILSVLAAGFPASNQWLWDFHDPHIIDPAKSRRHDVLAFVIFADIRGYTPLVDALGQGIANPREKLFEDALEAIKDRGGVVDKFIGDALLAYFFIQGEASFEEEGRISAEVDAAEHAAECALALQSLEVHVGSEHSLRFGVGMAFGKMYFGHFYYEKELWSRREITGLGSVVNRAQRLCALARKRSAFGENPAVLVDKEVSKYLNSEADSRKYSCVFVDEVRLKGLGDQNYYPIYTLQSNTTHAAFHRRIVLSHGFLSTPPAAVADAMADYYEYLKAGRGSPPAGDPGSQLPSEIASLLECSANHVTFRASTTDCIEDVLDTKIDHLIFHGTQPLIPRDKVVLMATDVEHPAVDAVIEMRFRDVVRIQLRNLEHTTEKGILRRFSETIEKCRPHILLFPHIVWDSGLRLPFRRIVDGVREICGDKSPMILVDGAHSLGHTRVKISLGEDPGHSVDAYATCGHKWLRGPHGVGILYVGSRLFDCQLCKRRLATGDMFTRLAGLGGEEVKSSQVRTQDRAKAYAMLAAVKDIKKLLIGSGNRSIPEGLDTEFDRLGGMRRRLLDTLQASTSRKIVELKPLPVPETSSGIVAFTVRNGNEDFVEKVRKRLHDVGIIIDVINETGFRCSLPLGITDEDVTAVAKAMGEAVNGASPPRPSRKRIDSDAGPLAL